MTATTASTPYHTEGEVAEEGVVTGGVVAEGGVAETSGGKAITKRSVTGVR